MAVMESISMDRPGAASGVSEAELRSVFDQAGIGMVLMKRDCTILHANAAFAAITGLSPGTLAGRSSLEVTHPDDIEATAAAVASLGDGAGPIAFEKRYVRADASIIWVRITLSPVDTGQLLAIVEDVTDRVEAQGALRESEARLRALAENIPALCWMADAHGAMVWFNPRWYAYTGFSPDNQEAWDWQALLSPSVYPKVVEHWRTAIATGEAFEEVLPLRGGDGIYRPFLTRMEPVRDEEGRLVRWFGFNIDVSEQQEYQQHLRLLIDELNHRVKNTLSIVQGIAQQTFRGKVPPELREAFEGRLAALAAAHNLLTRESWDSADLKDVVAEAVHAHDDANGRIRAEGPPVRLAPKTAVTIAMALHELGTNAAKYGALSNDSGRILIEWHLSEDEAPRLLLIWREQNGPRVSPPDHRGFGSKMIERALAYELRGTVRLDFAPEGVRCEIDAPLPKIPERTV